MHIMLQTKNCMLMFNKMVNNIPKQIFSNFKKMFCALKFKDRTFQGSKCITQIYQPLASSNFNLFFILPIPLNCILNQGSLRSYFGCNEAGLTKNHGFTR